MNLKKELKMSKEEKILTLVLVDDDINSSVIHC